MKTLTEYLTLNTKTRRAFVNITDKVEDLVKKSKIKEGLCLVNAIDVLGIIYNSKSGNTSLKWRQIRRISGKVSGEASSNSLVNLAEVGVITLDWVEKYVREKSQQDNKANKITS